MEIDLPRLKLRPYQQEIWDWWFKNRGDNKRLSLEWARRHGGDEGMGYAIQQKIAKQGVNAHPFFRPAMNEVKEKWMPQYMNKALEAENV